MNFHEGLIYIPYGIAEYTDKAVYAAIVLQLCLICTAKLRHTCSTEKDNVLFMYRKGLKSVLHKLSYFFSHIPKIIYADIAL